MTGFIIPSRKKGGETFQARRTRLKIFSHDPLLAEGGGEGEVCSPQFPHRRSRRSLTAGASVVVDTSEFDRSVGRSVSLRRRGCSTIDHSAGSV